MDDRKEWMLTNEQETDFVKKLIKEEGVKEFCYDDATGERVYAPVGKITIGIGINLDDGLSYEEAVYLCRSRLRNLQLQLSSFPFYKTLDIIRKFVLLNMAYNMGVPRVKGFKKMLTALTQANYELAAAQILDSKAARQLPVRYRRLAQAMATGK